MLTVSKDGIYMTIKVFRDKETNKIYAELINPEHPIVGEGETSAAAIGHLLQEIGIEFAGEDMHSVASMFVNL